MATIKIVSSGAPLKTALEYATNKEKTLGYTTGINCNVASSLDEMETIKLLYNKTKGRQYKHIVQSFAEGELTKELAHKIGVQFVKNCHQFEDYEVIVSTHCNTKNYHNHIIINSVNIRTGKKIQQSKKDLYEIRKVNDELCKSNGLSIPEKGKTSTGQRRKSITAYNKYTYKKLNDANKHQGTSWVHNIAVKIAHFANSSCNRQEFINNLQAVHISVNWSDTRKYITFLDSERELEGERCKIRNTKLSTYYNYDFSKEGLEKKFAINNQKILHNNNLNIKETARELTTNTKPGKECLLHESQPIISTQKNTKARKPSQIPKKIKELETKTKIHSL